MLRNMYFLLPTKIESLVYRNGKATKRSKSIWVWRLQSESVRLVDVDGHECWVRVSQDGTNYQMLYRADGTALIANVVYGYSGEKLRRAVLYWDSVHCTPHVRDEGYSGPTGRGWGCRIVNIEW